ncbi:T9SS type A sorting domain-containing protein [Polaribacter atrinae]|uniref:T9SS type A sorting domain-containing protein n=1 Tax=Polaribacter atrinae TaxID=1333662 RepID=UPI0024938BDE|nr:T9SS type A sorting domain-containing protein [Polaribacter atrinae]
MSSQTKPSGIKLVKFLLLAIAVIFIFKFIYNVVKTEKVTKLREKHQSYLDNSPFKESKGLSKKERRGLGLPPNAYNEQMWELTLDPNTGRPMPERVLKIQEELKEQRKLQRGGGDNFNAWVDRGPNNVGGRTRGIMFDPNDVDKNRVFAGGVSGGLWVNEDITDVNSSWSLVPDIGANISVTSIIYDPNDTETFYIGSGESYSSGSVVGRGVWKSTDKGVTWNNVFGGLTSANGGNFVNGIFYINDMVARDIGTTTELYISVAGAYFKAAANPNNFHGLNEQGVYKSIDNGVIWSKISINESNGNPSNPNDLELDLNNNIWVTTTRSSFGDSGGKILKSTDGIVFNLLTQIPNARRTELEVSSLDADKFWVAADIDGAGDLWFTDDAFASFDAVTNRLAEPNDGDNNITETDYTRGQAFYNLPIEVDVNDHLYVGGIDLFRSTDNGITWTQISKWSNNPGLSALNIPLVHADHHAIVFRPNAPTEAVFGNDGGVYYSPDITANAATLSINARNKDYNVTQFYYGSIASGTANEIILGGAQDNGTQIIQNAVSGANSFNNYFSFFSGDGSYSEIDQDGGGVAGRGEYMIVGSTGLSYYFAETSYTNANDAYFGGYTIVNSADGNFINEADLDDVDNILYANSSTDVTNQFSSFTLGENSAVRQDFANLLLDGDPAAFKVSPHTNTTLFLGTKNSKLLKITDLAGVPIWSDISGDNFIGSISDIEIGDTDQIIFVTVHNYGVTSLWYTADGGASWVSKEGNLPDVPVKCILQNPLKKEEVLIGTELGVWRTADFFAANPVWTQSYNGMSDVTVLDLDLRIADKTILATTHGRGMFTSQFSGDVITWTGAADTDWNLAANWDVNTVPTESNEVVIPSGLVNYPTASSAVTVNSISLNSGSSLIAQDDFTGNVTYNRNIPNTNWYLISSPVVGQDIDAFALDEGLAVGTGDNRGLSSYDNTIPTWVYYQNGATGSGNFLKGDGKSLKLATAGDVAFVGIIRTETETAVPLVVNANGLNLIGNPYTSFVPANNAADNTNNILKVNNTILDEETIWYWNQATNAYEIVNHVTPAKFIAPTQGFFVRANGANLFKFNETMQSHQNGDTFQKSANDNRPELVITLADESSSLNTNVYYIEGTTTSFDNGYDSSIFNGEATSLAIFTRTVAIDDERNLGIQSLPNSNFEGMIIPLGIKAISGSSITLSLKSINLPVKFNVYLEDKSNNSFTLLDDTTTFKTTLTQNLDGIGRFYIHTIARTLGNTQSTLNNAVVYVSEKTLHIQGIKEGNSKVKMFDLSGKTVLSTSIEGPKEIALSNLSTGVYLVHVESTLGRLVKKVIID